MLVSLSSSRSSTDLTASRTLANSFVNGNAKISYLLGMHRYNFFQYSPDTVTFIFGTHPIPILLFLVLADTEYRYRYICTKFKYWVHYFWYNFNNLILNNFWPQICINSTGSPLYEECLGTICHSLLYFAILTYIN